MKSKSSFVHFLFGIVGLIAFNSSAYTYANVYGTLDESQKRVIQSGQQVAVFENVPGEVWPRSLAYQRVEATPEEAMAVLADYARQHEYVHRVYKSVPVSTTDPTVKIVDYTMDLPFVVRPFFNPEYELRSAIAFLGPTIGYRMNWKLVHAESIGFLEGSAIIEPLPEGGSLISYTNFLSPKSHNRILESDMVMVRVKRGGGEALQTIVDRIESERKQNPSLLQEEVRALRAALHE